MLTLLYTKFARNKTQRKKLWGRRELLRGPSKRKRQSYQGGQKKKKGRVISKIEAEGGRRMERGLEIMPLSC